jgi:hypothetical protein
LTPETLDFHFDPMCPFAYATSLWLRSVRAQTGTTVDWRFFSLEEANRAEGKKHPWERPWSYGWSLTTTHDDIRADHERVVGAGGYGVPTLFFPGGQCLFGPVLIDPPRGERALRLWDVVTGMLEFPHLYEIQRPKSAADQQAIAEALTPYLAGRDWVSINRGEVIEFSKENS